MDDDDDDEGAVKLEETAEIAWTESGSWYAPPSSK